MRIVGGRYKGKRLHPPSKLRARPTTDFAKEALFNILQHSVPLEGIKVLDLFAGTGSMSLEFLSRGAEQVLSVDSDRAAHSFMLKMAREMQLLDWTIICTDVFNFLEKHQDRYDIIFADPPFGIERHVQLTELILEKQMLLPEGRLIIEHPASVKLDHLHGYIGTRDYGSVNFSSFEPEPNAS